MSLRLSRPNNNGPKMNMAAFVCACEGLAPRNSRMRSAFVGSCSKALKVFVFTRLFSSFVKQFWQSLYFSGTSSLSLLVLAADMARLSAGDKHATNRFVLTHKGQVPNFAAHMPSSNTRRWHRTSESKLSELSLSLSLMILLKWRRSGSSALSLREEAENLSRTLPANLFNSSRVISRRQRVLTAV